MYIIKIYTHFHLRSETIQLEKYWECYAKFLRNCAWNKANLRDLIAATGLVFLLKIVNHQFFSRCDLEIWWIASKNNRASFLYYFQVFCILSKPSVNSNWNYSPEMLNSGQNRLFSVPRDLEIWRMTLKNNRAPLPCYFKLCASFQSHRWIQTGVTVRKCSIRVKIGDYLSCVTFKFDGWPSKTTGHLFHATSSFVHHFKANDEFKLELQSGNAQFGSKSAIFFYPCDLGIWRMTLKNNRAPLLWQCKLCASFRNHWWIQTWSYCPETPKLGQNLRFFELHDLEIWRMTLKNYRAPLLSLSASFHHHISIQTGVTVQKRLNWVLTSVTLTFDLWTGPFAWTSLLSLVIVPENFMMIRWWEHSEKGVTDRQTDRRTDGLNHS